LEAELARSVCRLVAGLVVSDDDFAPEEEAFLSRMLTRFGVGDREAIFPIVSREEAAEKVRELPPWVQEEALLALVGAAVADGQVVDEERGYLVAVGEAMGLDEAAIARRIDAALAAHGKP
jgi:hypothetical protein